MRGISKIAVNPNKDSDYEIAMERVGELFKDPELVLFMEKDDE